MKAADKRKQEQRVKDAVLDAEQTLGLDGHYEVTLNLDWGLDHDDEIDEEGTTNVALTTATTNASWQYRKVRFRYRMPHVAAISDERLFAVAVHEWAHVLLNPLDSFVIFANDNPRAADAEKANEFTTESVARALLAAAGREYPGAGAWLDEV